MNTVKARNQLSNYVINNSPFILIYTLLFLISLFHVLIYEKGTFLIIVNQMRHQYLDIFFSYLSYMGNEYFFIAVILIFYFYKKHLIKVFVFSYGIAYPIVWSLKQITNTERPYQYFGENTIIKYVDGIALMSTPSMPSLHATIAFIIFTVLSLHFNNKYLSAFFILIASLFAFSRFYLLQHFLEDIIVGSMIGVAVPIFVYYFFVIRKRENS